MSWIRKLRLEKRETLKAVAEKVGISEGFLSQIENGARTPSVKVAKAIAGVLGVDWVRFFEQEGTEK